MVGKQGEGVAQAFDDLILSEVASESEVGALKSRACELGAGEIRAVEQRVAQIGVGEIGAVEPGIGQIGAGQVGAGEVRAGKRREAQRFAAQPCRGEVDRAAVHGAHLPLSGAQEEPDQVGHRGGVLPAPIVPRPWPAAQGFHMFGVGQCYEGSGKEMGPVFSEGTLLGLCDSPMKQEVMHGCPRRAIMR